MLKGKTIIELTNTKTGEVETFEDNNLVTQAINEIILKRKRYTGFQVGVGSEDSETRSSFISMFPLYKRFFGGIMLFSNTIDENRLFLSGDDVIVGSATFGNASSGLDSAVGSYNATESEINEEEKYVKFVYDFATNQANGAISTVCLGNYHYIKHALYGTICSDEYANANIVNVLNAPFNNGEYFANQRCAYDPNVVLFPTGVKIEGTTPKDYLVSSSSSQYCYETPILYDEEKGHLITFEYCYSDGAITYSNVANVIRLHVYDVGLYTVSLFNNFDKSYYSRLIPKEVFRKDFPVTNFGSYGVYNLQTTESKQGWYDKSTGFAYLLGDNESNVDYWTANSVMSLFKFDLNVANYEDITLELVRITNKTGNTLAVASTKEKQNYNRAICIHNGYLYAPVGEKYSTTGIAKININDSTDVTVIEGAYNYVADVKGDLLYLANEETGNNGKYVVVLNTKTNEIKYTKALYSSVWHSNKPVPFKNNNTFELYTGLHQSSFGEVASSSRKGDLAWFGTPCSRNDYFATINNLETPVTKTAETTMKITYILREGTAVGK